MASVGAASGVSGAAGGLRARPFSARGAVSGLGVWGFGGLGVWGFGGLGVWGFGGLGFRVDGLV